MDTTSKGTTLDAVDCNTVAAQARAAELLAADLNEDATATIAARIYACLRLPVAPWQNLLFGTSRRHVLLHSSRATPEDEVLG